MTKNCLKQSIKRKIDSINSLKKLKKIYDFIYALIRDEIKFIQIWRFEDAPEEYRKHFSEDDADWLAFVPNYLLKKEGDYIPFLEEGTSFGCCRVEEVKIKEGKILVGYHA